MTAQIVVGRTLASACALATNVASIVEHRGANAVPAFEIGRPLRGTRLLLGSGWFACGPGLALFAGVLHIAGACAGIGHPGGPCRGRRAARRARRAPARPPRADPRGQGTAQAIAVIALTGVTANIADIAAGIVVFKDPLGHGPLAFVGESLAFVLVVVGAALVRGGAGTSGDFHPPRRRPQLA